MSGYFKSGFTLQTFKYVLQFGTAAYILISAFFSLKDLAISFSCVFRIPCVPASLHCLLPFHGIRVIFFWSCLFCIKKSTQKSKCSFECSSLAKYILVWQDICS